MNTCESSCSCDTPENPNVGKESLSPQDELAWITLFESTPSYFKPILSLFTKNIISMPISSCSERSETLTSLLSIEGTQYALDGTFQNFLTRVDESGYFTQPIRIKSIYDKLLVQIYFMDDDADEIHELLTLCAIPQIRSHHEKGYQLGHHIIACNNEAIINPFLIEEQTQQRLALHLTTNYIIHQDAFTVAIPGQQTLLHIAAQSNRALYPHLHTLFESNTTAVENSDAIGFTAKEYFAHRNDVVFEREINRRMKDSFAIHYPFDRMIVDTFAEDQLRNDMLAFLAKASLIRPNSMHEYGVVLDTTDNDTEAGKDRSEGEDTAEASAPSLIQRFLAQVDTRYGLHLAGKCYHIYAFTAEYHMHTNKRLDVHKDNALITINWNIDISDELEGTEVIFPPLENKRVEAKKDQILIHHGKVEHYVTPLQQGYRKNLIVWLK